MANICTNEIYITGNSTIINIVDEWLKENFDCDLTPEFEEIYGYFYSKWVAPIDKMEQLLLKLNNTNEKFYIRIFSYELATYYHQLFWSNNEVKEWIEE